MSIIHWPLKGEDITLFGDGSQTRSFCYVDDLIEGMMRFMALPGPKDPGHEGQLGFPGPINLGNPCEFTITELAELVVKLTGSRSKLVYRPLPQDDPMRRRPDISRAEQYLQGWQPSVALEEGLKPTIAYFDTLLSGTSGRVWIVRTCTRWPI